MGPGIQAQAPFLITILAGAEFKFWDSCTQNKASEISKIALSGSLGLLCAEQNVGNLKKHFQDFWDSGAQNKTSKISKMHHRGPNCRTQR